MHPTLEGLQADLYNPASHHPYKLTLDCLLYAVDRFQEDSGEEFREAFSRLYCLLEDLERGHVFPFRSTRREIAQ